MNPTYVRIPAPASTLQPQVSLAQLRLLASHGAEHGDKELRFDGTVAKIKIGSAWAFRREASREAHQQAFVSLLTRAVQQALPSAAGHLVQAHSVDGKGQLYRVSGLKRLFQAVDAQASQPARHAPAVAWGGPSSRQLIQAQPSTAGRPSAAEYCDSPRAADFATPLTTERKQAPPAAKADEDTGDLQYGLDRPLEYGKVLAGMQPDAMMGRILITGSALQHKDRSWMQKFVAGWIEGREVQGSLPRASAQSIAKEIGRKSLSEGVKKGLTDQLLGHVARQDRQAVLRSVAPPHRARAS